MNEVKIEMYEKVTEITIETEGLLTAHEARAITDDWQNNEIGRCVKYTLTRVREEAKNGASTLLIDISRYGVNMDIRIYVTAMKELGYRLTHRSGYWFTWEL